MIIAGWKKGAREVAYLGINKCPNCKNYSHFAFYEIATKATLFFIPVAKIKKQYVMSCNLCNATWELDSSNRDEILRKSVTIPERDYVTNLWNEIDQDFLSTQNTAQSLSELSKQDVVNVFYEVIERITHKHSSPQADYVIKCYLECLNDPDKPR